MMWTTKQLASFFCGIAMLAPVAFAQTRETEKLVASGSPAVTVQSTPAKSKAAKASKEIEGVEVEMFRAIADGQLEVQYIAKDATQANLIFHNKTEKPLKITLPDTFGAVHVLAQGMGGMGGGMGGMGGGMGGMGGGMGGGGGQAMGGGMDGGGMDPGMGGGMFRVDIDKPRKMPVATVCLEHGKKDPTPRMKYAVVPLEAINADPSVTEVCKLLGNGRISQNTAQAAAWHVASGLSWQALVNKPRVVSKYTGVEMYFSQFEVQAAMRLVAHIKVEVADKVAASSSESSDSESENPTP